MFALKSCEKELILLHVRSKVVKIQWFNYVFAQTCENKLGCSYGCSACFWKIVSLVKIIMRKCNKHKKVKKCWFYFEQCFKDSWNRCKTHVFQKKGRETNPSNGFGVRNSNTRKDALWGNLTAKLFRENTLRMSLKSKKNPSLLIFSVPSHAPFDPLYILHGVVDLMKKVGKYWLVYLLFPVFREELQAAFWQLFNVFSWQLSLNFPDKIVRKIEFGHVWA